METGWLRSEHKVAVHLKIPVVMAVVVMTLYNKYSSPTEGYHREESFTEPEQHY